jgi:N-terminal 7TM region of histidine kinase
VQPFLPCPRLRPGQQDDVRVECGAGPSCASYRFNEFGNVQNAVFEQVADTYQETANFIVMLGVSALMAVEALAAWRRLRFAGGRALSLTLVVGAVESLCYALVFSLGKGLDMLHVAAIYAFTGPLLGAFWLIFAIRFAGLRLPHGRWLETILVGAAVGLVVIVAADPSLIFPSSVGLTALSVDRSGGALFSIQLIWFSLLVAAGIVLLLVEALRSWRLIAPRSWR